MIIGLLMHQRYNFYFKGTNLVSALSLTEQEAEMMKKKLRKTKRIIVSREKSFIVAVLILSKP